MKEPKYHDKKYTHLTCFNHTRKQEVKMMRAVQQRVKDGSSVTNKSELIRELIDNL